jgi:hypothetical protein
VVNHTLIVGVSTLALIVPWHATQDRDRFGNTPPEVRKVLEGPDIQWIGIPGHRIYMAKMKLRYSRAADLAEAFGGGILDAREAQPPDPNRATFPSDPWYGQQAQNLLPEGIDSVIAQIADNTLIFRGTYEGMAEFITIVRAIDVRPEAVEVEARVQVIVKTPSGSRTVLDARSLGRTAGERRAHLKHVAAGPMALAAGASLDSATSDLDVYGRPLGDGSFSVHADWYVDFVWRAAGKAKPLRINNIFRSDGITTDGKTITVTRSTVKLPAGSAELVLQLTPRTARDAIRPPAKAALSK